MRRWPSESLEPPCGVALVILPGRDAVGVPHAADSGERWAENNRGLRDLLHRGRVPPQRPPAEHEDEAWAPAEVA